MITAKKGDQYPVTFTANTDLTGATIRLTARPRGTTIAPTILPATITDAPGGVVTHTLTGTLPVGAWYVELEVTRAGQVVTFPTGAGGQPAFELLVIVPDNDS